MSSVTRDTPPLEPAGRLGSGGELGAGDEELALEAQDVFVGLAPALGGRARQPEGGGRLVDRPVRLRAACELGDTTAVPEPRRAVIALACVDLDQAAHGTRGQGHGGRLRRTGGRPLGGGREAEVHALRLGGPAHGGAWYAC